MNKYQRAVKKLKSITGCEDESIIQECLTSNGLEVSEAVVHMKINYSFAMERVEPIKRNKLEGRENILDILRR